jgi:hypothetical protein
MRPLRALLTVLLIAALYAQHTRAQESCAPASPLASGMWARVADEGLHNLRAAPTTRAERSGGIEAGDIFYVEASAGCADGYGWWHVRYAGEAAYIADVLSAATGWYTPLDGQDTPAPAEQIDGCLRPPHDYAQIALNGYAVLNLRTLAMLDHAQALYSAGGGIIRIRPSVMQGSYAGGAIAASFGTHDGGGAVDISVRDLQTRQVLEREIEPLLMALRTAGFAAWLRRANQLYDGSVIHIHAIAVGDAELSEYAWAQVDGELGYLNGYNGLPPEWGGPEADDLPMVICEWMRPPQ